MNHSKYGLNAPFYKWLDEVRQALRREQELLQKLEYYNVKFMGYQGITYDRIGSSSGNNSKGDQNMLYWLDKIDETEKELNSFCDITHKFYCFQNSLTSNQKKLLRLLLLPNCNITKHCKSEKITRHNYYRSINEMARVFEKYW